MHGEGLPPFHSLWLAFEVAIILLSHIFLTSCLFTTRSTALLAPYLSLDQRGKVQAEYVWVDGDGKYIVCDRTEIFSGSAMKVSLQLQ